MNRRTRFIVSEKGQSIVIIALVMVALLALTGLAIDGGNMYLERRRAQNAADGSAMAGTRILALAMCGEAGANDSAINIAVQQYAQQNDVQDLGGLDAVYVNIEETELGTVGAGQIPVSTSGVKVTVDKNVATYLLRVIGIEEADVSATATAMTGPPESMSGLRPIGLPLDVYQTADTCPDPIELNFGNCPSQCMIKYTKSGEEYRHQHRGYLNLAYAWKADEGDSFDRAFDKSGDANKLKEWMEFGYFGSRFYADYLWFPNDNSRFGDFIHAKSGRNSSVIGVAPVNETIVIPIFDYVPHYDEINEPYRHTVNGADDYYANSKPEAAAAGGGYYYHIVGFATLWVGYAHQGQGTIGGCIDKEASVTGYGKVSDDPALQSGYGQVNACQSTLQAINLWR